VNTTINHCILDNFDPIELSQMDSVRLMNRIDTKYLTDINTVEKVLRKAAQSGYLALEIQDKKAHPYKSLYYDSPDLRMYLDHHNRRLTRQKLRTRSYSNGQTFLELKTKNNHGRTKKKRIEISSDNYLMANFASCEQIGCWLESKLFYSWQELSPALETEFSRITLVNPEMTERATIDFELNFNNIRNGLQSDLGQLAIIEVKQDSNTQSTLRDILLEERVKPFRISKYCIGTALTNRSIKRCRFKEKIILINKLNDRISNSQPSGKRTA